jgi:hypothetical protein
MADLQLPSVVRLEKSGLWFVCRPSLHLWEHIGRRIISIVDSSAWWVADWLVYGEDSFPDRYAEAIRGTDLNYQTLRNYAWVARRIEQRRRRDALSFAHHAEVASLKQAEQDYWLLRAERQGWSRNRLRGEVRTARQPCLHLPAKPCTIRIPLTSRQAALFEAAAQASRVPVQEWASDVLEHLAQESCESDPVTGMLRLEAESDDHT